MSWDSYIDNLLGHTAGHADKAAIVGMDGSKWTSDVHANALKLSANEAAAIGKAMQSGEFGNFQASGVYVEGVKYQYLRHEEGKVVLAKKKDMGAITMQKSKTSVVIGHTIEGKQQGSTNKGVAVIAEYLESLNM